MFRSGVVHFKMRIRFKSRYFKMVVMSSRALGGEGAAEPGGELGHRRALLCADVDVGQRAEARDVAARRAGEFEVAEVAIG